VASRQQQEQLLGVLHGDEVGHVEVEQDAQVELEVQVMVWSTMLVRMMMVRRQRRRVHDRGETSSQSPIG
jgi:hypothetical protein